MLQVLDVSDPTKIDCAIQLIEKSGDKIDVLINNAGIFLSEYLETSEGLEIQWMVNYLAHYVLTRRLLDLLKVADDSRVINVSSNAHFKGRINFEDLNGFSNYRGFQAYSQSKLAKLITEPFTERYYILE